MKAWRLGDRQRISAAIRASTRPGLQPLNTSVHASRLRAGAVVQHGCAGSAARFGSQPARTGWHGLQGLSTVGRAGAHGRCPARSGGAAGSSVTIGGGTMNDPVAATSDARDLATALGPIPAIRQAVIMDVFATMDAGDIDAMVAHMTDDVSTQFGNLPEVC